MIDINSGEVFCRQYHKHESYESALLLPNKETQEEFEDLTANDGR